MPTSPSAISVRTLACGMPLIIERMSAVRSVGFSWLLPAGCAAEPHEREGVTALLEEMLLRGSGTRDSRADADEFDRLGVSRSVESGTFTMRVGATMLGTHVRDALPLLVDIVRRPRCEASALEPSRELCLQAIESLKDDPQTRASLLARARHHPHPLNRSGLGSVEGLEACTRDDLLAFWTAHARPRGSILAMAGDVDADSVERQLNDLLNGWAGSEPPLRVDAHAPRGYAHEMDSSSQVQIIVVYDAPPEPSPDAILEKLALSVLSGGMSGRLFSEVREKRGLCYAVSAGYRGDKTFGSVSAYVGTTPERAQESLDVLRAELHRITTPQGRITAEEFHRAKVGMKSSLVFSGESSGARAAALAADQRRLGRPRSLEEVAAEVESVTLDRLNAYVATRTPGVMTVQTLGPAALRVS